jgi:hypothetical protein
VLVSAGVDQNDRSGPEPVARNVAEHDHARHRR